MAQTIDEYLDGFPEETQAALRDVRRTIAEAAPDATETFSYGIPTFDLAGTHLVHYAGFKSHVGFYHPERHRGVLEGALRLRVGEGLGPLPSRPADAPRADPADHRVPGARGDRCGLRVEIRSTPT